MRHAVATAILTVVPAWLTFGQSTAGPPVLDVAAINPNTNDDIGGKERVLAGGRFNAEAYGKLRVTFESNQGQTGSEVEFLSRNNGYSLYLTSTEAVLSLQTDEQRVSELSSKEKGNGTKRPTRRGAIVRMKLVGANPSARVTGLDQLPGKSNYFIGNDPNKWRLGIPTYAKVKYTAIYPGIDMVFYGNQRELEYDITVAPGADPRRIRFRLEGVDRMRFRAGDVMLGVSSRQLRIKKPFVYQPCASGRCQITGEFVRTGENEIGFQVAAYDTTRPLVLDPVISYSTYLGGTGFDAGKGITVDASGNVTLPVKPIPLIFPRFRRTKTPLGVAITFLC